MATPRSLDRFGGDVHVAGRLTCGEFSLPESTVRNENIVSEAGIEADKLQHQYTPGYAQESATAAADEARVIHVAQGDGTIIGFLAGNVVSAIGDDTCTVDLKKNGTTVLSAPVSLVAADPVAYAEKTGTISSASYSAGDVLEVVINATHNTGTLAKGIYASAVLQEDANPS